MKRLIKILSIPFAIFLGDSMEQLKALPRKAMNWFWNQFSINLLIDDTEIIYWFQTLHINSLKHPRSFLVSLVDSDDINDKRAQVNLHPVLGGKLLRWHGVWVWARYNGGGSMALRRRKSDGDGDDACQPKLSGLEGCVGYNVRMFTFDLNKVNAFLAELRNANLTANNHIRVYYPCGTSWEREHTSVGRQLDSVILKNGVLEELIEDIQRFQNDRDRYAGLGIAFRHGIMLYGPPGNGKTTVVTALATALDVALQILPLSEGEISDAQLRRLMSGNKNSIILIEDIDCAMVSRDKSQSICESTAGPEGYTIKDKIVKNGLTFSGLLNAIDGISTSKGRILIMTTNHREKLDPALIRPGRVDYQVEIGNADRDQAKRLFVRFYGEEGSDTFASMIEDGKWSMAELQQHMLSNSTGAMAVLTWMNKINKKVLN